MDGRDASATGPGPEADTPAARRRRKARDAIFGAAERLFRTGGVQALSMRRIAEETDYTVGALYTYFDSKDALIDAIRESFFERLLARLDSMRDDAPWTEDSACAFLRSYVECGLERPHHYQIAFTGDPGHDVPTPHGEKLAEAAMRLQAMIEEAMAQGLFTPVDAAVAAKSVWMAMHGLTWVMAEHPEFPVDAPWTGDFEQVDVVDYHIRLLVAGLVRGPVAHARGEN